MDSRITGLSRNHLYWGRNIWIIGINRLGNESKLQGSYQREWKHVNFVKGFGYFSVNNVDIQ